MIANAYRLPMIRAGFGNRALNLLDALAQVSADEAVIVTRDRELGRIYKGPTSGQAPLFKRPLQLSETLFNRGKIDLASYFHLTPDSEVCSKTVAIHFRGRDFAAWKKHSIIDPNFYIRQILECPPNATIYLFTDDPQHSTVRSILCHCEAAKRNLLFFRGSLFSDFSLMSRASRIVASPSTFSLCAAIFGGGRITFPRTYAETEAQAGYDFWGRLLAGQKPNYITVTLA